MNRQVFLCTCGHNEHQMIITAIDDPIEEFFVCISPSLCDNLSLLTRVKYAVKYIFGHRSKYGMFSDIILTKADTTRLIDALAKAVRSEEPHDNS
jgi:hypothetical protein